MTKGFVHRFTECAIEVGFTTQNECKVIDGIIGVVHEHLDIIEDSGTEVLGFVNGKKQGLSFLFFIGYEKTIWER